MDLARILIMYLSLLISSTYGTVMEGDVSKLLPVTPKPTVQVTQEIVVVTPAPTAVPGNYTSLSEGSTGDKVKRLQQALKDLGYLTGRVDGSYGAQTRQAVKDFQAANGLTADGVAGPSTQYILYSGKAVKKNAPTATPAATAVPQQPVKTAAPTAVPGPAQVHVLYKDQWGNVLYEGTQEISGTILLSADDSRIGEGYTLESEREVQILYWNGKAYPANVTFLYHSSFVPESTLIPVYYVTYDSGERVVLYEETAEVSTGSFITVTADPDKVQGYTLISAKSITIVSDEEASVAPAEADFVFTAETVIQKGDTP